MEAAVAAMERELAAAAAACEASTASAEEAKHAGALLRAEASTAMAVHRKQVKHMQALSTAPAHDPALPVAEGKTVTNAAAAASGANSPRAPAATTAGFQLQEGDFPQLPSLQGKTASPGRRSRTPPELFTVGYVTPADARERAGDAPASVTAAATDIAGATATAAATGVEPPPLRARRMTDSEKARLIEQQQAELRGWHERDFDDITAEAAAGGDGAGGVTAPPTAGEVHAAAERDVQRAQAVEVEARDAKWVARVQQYKKHNTGVSLEEAVHRVWESYVNSFYLYHPDTTPAPPGEPPAWYLGAIAASTTSPRHTWAQLEASPEPPPPARTAAPQPPAAIPVVAGPTPRRYQHMRHGASTSSSPQGSPPAATAVAAAPPGYSTAVAAATSHRQYQHTRHGPPPSPTVPLPVTTAVARNGHRPTVSTTAHHGHRAAAAASTNNGHSPNPATNHHGHRPPAVTTNTQRGHIIRHTNLPPYTDRPLAPTYQQPKPTPSPAAAPRARTTTPPAAQTRYHIRHTNVPSWSATSAALEADPSRMHNSSALWAAAAEIDARRSRRHSAAAPTAPHSGGPSEPTTAAPTPTTGAVAAPSRGPVPEPSSAFVTAMGEGPASSPWVPPTREPGVSERERELEQEVQRLAVQLAAAGVGGGKA
ncbi:unnamed protein product, partial [Ectocarpus sp. 6 AP-2014]